MYCSSLDFCCCFELLIFPENSQQWKLMWEQPAIYLSLPSSVLNKCILWESQIMWIFPKFLGNLGILNFCFKTLLAANYTHGVQTGFEAKSKNVLIHQNKEAEWTRWVGDSWDDRTRTPALPGLLPYFQSLPLPSHSSTEDGLVPSPAEVRRLSSLNSHFNQSQGEPVQIFLSHVSTPVA